jgi:hypothetical protein
MSSSANGERDLDLRVLRSGAWGLLCRPREERGSSGALGGGGGGGGGYAGGTGKSASSWRA